jgi:predicted nucleic acid-binding protein
MPGHSVIVDTSALYALVDADDVHHGEATRYLRQLGRNVSLEIVDTTLMEALTLIKRRLGADVASQTLQAIQGSSRYRTVRLTEEERREMWRLFEQYADKQWSPFDCASLAVARARKIQEAFAFDVHFAKMAAAGLIRVPASRDG